MSSFEQNLMLAKDRLNRDQTDDAIESLRACLAERPDDSPAHALMAIALIDRKRRHAARHEADQALASDPEEAMAHYANGIVAIAERKFDRAREAFEQQRQLEPENDLWVLASANLALLERRFDDTETLVALGLRMNPDNENFHIKRAILDYQEGNIAKAKAAATEALRLAPGSGEANAIMGDILFADHDGAREHAVMALQASPQSEDALNLLAKLSLSKNPLYWLWWKYAALLARMGTRLTILLLLGLFALVQIGSTALNQAGYPMGSTFLTAGWLAFVIYSWSAPAMIERAIRKELADVRLSPEY